MLIEILVDESVIVWFVEVVAEVVAVWLDVMLVEILVDESVIVWFVEVVAEVLAAWLDVMLVEILVDESMINWFVEVFGKLVVVVGLFNVWLVAEDMLVDGLVEEILVVWKVPLLDGAIVSVVSSIIVVSIIIVVSKSVLFEISTGEDEEIKVVVFDWVWVDTGIELGFIELLV